MSKGLGLRRHIYSKNFQTKDLGPLRHFLEIEIARSKKSTSLSQWKYILDILSEAGMLGCKYAETPMDPILKLLLDQRKLLEDQGRYMRLVRKLKLFDNDLTKYL